MFVSLQRVGSATCSANPPGLPKELNFFPWHKELTGVDWRVVCPLYGCGTCGGVAKLSLSVRHSVNFYTLRPAIRSQCGWLGFVTVRRCQECESQDGKSWEKYSLKSLERKCVVCFTLLLLEGWSLLLLLSCCCCFLSNSSISNTSSNWLKCTDPADISEKPDYRAFSCVDSVQILWDKRFRLTNPLLWSQFMSIKSLHSVLGSLSRVHWLIGSTFVVVRKGQDAFSSCWGLIPPCPFLHKIK